MNLCQVESECSSFKMPMSDRTLAKYQSLCQAECQVECWSNQSIIELMSDRRPGKMPLECWMQCQNKCQNKCQSIHQGGCQLAPLKAKLFMFKAKKTKKKTKKQCKAKLLPWFRTGMAHGVPSEPMQHMQPNVARMEPLPICISMFLMPRGKDLRIVTFKNVTAAMCSYFGSVPLFGGKGSIVCVEMGQTSSPEKKGLICGLVVFPRK